MFQSFTPMQYLKIDVANNYGKDKLDWEDRIAWFDENEHKLLTIVHEAKEGPLFYAGVMAYRNTKEGKVNHYPISLDGTSSGFQWLSLMTHDVKAARLCNVIDTGHREDAYTTIYKMMDVGDRIAHSVVKKAIMTAMYSSVAEPKKAFGDGAMLEHFENTMMAAAPIAWMMNLAFVGMWNPNATEYSWQLPDLFTVHTKVMAPEERTIIWENHPYQIIKKVNKPTAQGRSLGANSTHSVDALAMNEMIRRCMHNPEQVRLARDVCFGMPGQTITEKDNEMVEALWNQCKKTNFLSARIIQHLNAENIEWVDKERVLLLLGSLPAKPFQILTVHDCFRCLPNYANDMRKQYNRIMYDVANARILESIIHSITGKDLFIPKDPTFAPQVLESNYSIT